jgi:nitrite reductase/ring-hydroxylating ferredoxin subunit
MGDHETEPRPTTQRAFDPHTTPVPRRRMLVLMSAGAIAAGGGLGVILQACAGPPVTVALDVNPDDLVPGTPTEVPFTLDTGSSTVAGSTWLVKKVSGEITAFDPRCTHGLCRYNWSPDGARFKCQCHDGQFALDGAVLAGPPPKPLNQFPVRLVGDVIEVDVPSDFQTPKESLPS